MSWTAPKTWVTSELVTAPLMNDISNNLTALKNPPTVSTRYVPGTWPQITSTTSVDIHSSLNFSLTTNGGSLMVGLVGRVFHHPGTNVDCFFDVNINGVSETAGAGLGWLIGPNSLQFPFSLVWLTAARPAGAYTVKIQCRRGGNPNAVQIVELYTWIREVS